MTHWRRRQTGRQAFFFRVIGSSSTRIKLRLTDGDVIAVEVFRESLLASRILGVLDIHLCNEVVVGLITCGGVLLGQVPSSSAEVRGLVIHDIKEVEGERQQEEQEYKRDEEERGVSEDSNLRQSVRASNKEDSQRTTTLTDNKERLRKRRSSKHEDSCIGINYAHMFPKCFRSLHTVLGFALYFVSSIKLLSLYHLLNWLVREFLVEIHTAKTGLLRCCLYSYSLKHFIDAQLWNGLPQLGFNRAYKCRKRFPCGWKCGSVIRSLLICGVPPSGPRRTHRFPVETTFSLSRLFWM